MKILDFLVSKRLNSGKIRKVEKSILQSGTSGYAIPIKSGILRRFNDIYKTQNHKSERRSN